MTSLWIDHRHMKIRSFGSSTKGTRGIVKIEIEVSDPSAPGYLLKELGEANAEIDRARAASAEAERQEKKRLSRPTKPLALTYSGGGHT